MATAHETMEAHPPIAQCHHAAKWAALVDDVVVPMPRRTVAACLIKEQAGVGPEFILVRDFNSPDDVVLNDADEVDLAEGNVFYRLRSCEVPPRGHCDSPPKLAFFVDDRFEVVIRPSQTGRTLRELFALAPGAQLFRDTEGTDDQSIAPDEEVRFGDGPVFYYRTAVGLTITVNSRVFGEAEGVKSHMTGREIASLVYPENPDNTRVWEVSPTNREIGLGQPIDIEPCMAFDTVRKNVTGGFEASRVERELDLLHQGGLKVTLVTGPVPAVVYHDLRGTLGGAPATTDVLVPVPQAYPGQFIDYGYLPMGSPFIGKVLGAPQEPRISALDKVWQQISYHPHTNGGGPAWNPGLHGFHTYVGELLSWLRTS